MYVRPRSCTQRLRARLSVAVLFGVCAIGLGAENLLRNGSFEQFSVADDGRETPGQWTTAAPWFAKPKDRGLSEVSLDKTVVFGGARALCIVGQGNRGIAWQVVTDGFEAGDRLEMSGRVKLKDLDRGLAWMRGEFKTRKGKILGTMGAHSQKHNVGVSDWIELRAQGTVPQEATLLQFFLSTGEPNTGRVWFDNVELRKVGGEAPQTAPRERAAFVGLIPLDAFDSPESKWSSGRWGAGPPVPPNRTEILEEDGEKRLRIEYAAAKTFVSRKWEYPGEWTALCFRARRVSGSGGLAAMIAAGGLGYYTHGIHDLSAEWQDYAVPVGKFRSDRTGEPLTAGREAGELKLYSYGETTIEVARLSVAVPPQVGIREAFTEEMANIFEPGSAPTARVSLFNSHPQKVRATLRCVLRNYRGAVLHETERECVLKAQSLAEERITLPKLAAGYFSCEFALETDKVLDRKGMGVVVMPARPRTAIRRPFVGFSIFGGKCFETFC